MPDNVRRFRWKKSGEMSAADLVRECGEKLTDRELWRQFEERFQGLIFMYVMRSLRLRYIQDDIADIVPDLAQEVYLKLVQHEGRALLNCDYALVAVPEKDSIRIQGFAGRAGETYEELAAELTSH